LGLFLSSFWRTRRLLELLPYQTSITSTKWHTCHGSKYKKIQISGIHFKYFKLFKLFKFGSNLKVADTSKWHTCHGSKYTNSIHSQNTHALGFPST
jgi:hypothetical protein